MGCRLHARLLIPPPVCHLTPPKHLCAPVDDVGLLVHVLCLIRFCVVWVRTCPVGEIMVGFRCGCHCLRADLPGVHTRANLHDLPEGQTQGVLQNALHHGCVLVSLRCFVSLQLGLVRGVGRGPAEEQPFA